MKIQRIDHVGIIVNDLPAAKAFFLDCGLEMMGEGNVDGEWVDRIVGLRGVEAAFVMLRTPDGEQELRPWDCVFCPIGEAGAHKVTNHGDEPARILIWSNRSNPGTTIYPDSNKVGAWPPGKLFRLDDAVDYFEGEV